MLIDPKILAATRYDQPPTVEALTELDSDMRRILDSRDLSPREKVESYNQILQKHQHFYQLHRAPLQALPPPPPSQSPPPPTQPPTEINKEDKELKEIVSSVPAKFQRKGQLLLERLRKNPDIDWNERGELVVKGQVISGSNVVDLVNDALRRRKRFEPRGWEIFADALRETNVPQDLVGNPTRWSYISRGMRRMHQTPDEGSASTQAWHTLKN